MDSTVGISQSRSMNLPLLCRKTFEEEPKNDELEKKFRQIQLDSGTLHLEMGIFKNISIDQLENRGIIGEGACGVVSKRKYKGRYFAVKEMKRTECVQEMKRILMDLNVIRQSNECPYIVKYLGYILTSQDLYICMELMTSCLEVLLKKVGKGLPEAIIGKIAFSVVNGLNYLIETLGIMHRDVKPSNMLIDHQGHIKLCDFGIAGQLIEYLPPSVTMGCVAYLAPERVERKPYDMRADVWSLGISLIYLANAKFPYDQDTQFSIMLQILNEPAPSLCVKTTNYSLDFCKFVSRCLQKDMNQRAVYSELMIHPFYIKSQDDKIDVAKWYNKYNM